MKVESHFTMLVYPFYHVISDEARKARLQKLHHRWHPWWRRFARDELKRTLDDTYFFLPYIREMLFPETAHLPAGDASQQVTEADELARLSTDQLAEKLLPAGVLRLTYNPEQLRALHPLRLEFERRNAQGKVVEDFSAPFNVCWADVALFPQHAGFLILKVELDENSLSVSRLNDFLYYLRLVHAPALDWQLANWNRTKAEAPLTFKSRDLVDFLLQGLTNGHDYLDPTMEAFVERRRRSGSGWRYSATGAGQVYGQVFHQYSYACLASPASTTAQSEITPATAQPPPLAATASPSPLFASPAQQALYELATCTQTTDPDYQPHSSGLQQIMEKSHIALWANWEGMALHDNVVFLGTLATHFTRRTLVHNVESDYFHLYLLTLYQKVRLSVLSGELMRRGANLHRNLREARSLWDAFVMFRNHYWFAEVTLRPQGTELYRRFQQGLDVFSLYEAISNEVRELQEYYEHKVERRVAAAMRQVQRRMTEHLNTIKRIQEKVEWIEIAVASVYLAHLGEMITKHIDESYVVGAVIGGAVLGGVGAAMILRPWKHRKHRSEPRSPEVKPTSVSDTIEKSET
jgi:hypothetical protein